VTTPPVIAIVDDDVPVRHAMGRLVRSFGWRVALFGSGPELLQANHLDRLDCIITDMQMPGMDGLALCAAIRTRELAMPVIFMSAFAHAAYEQAANSMGAICFLHKPFDDHELLRCIECALSSRRPGASR
jgi:FixJ family two-component response regulator